MAKKIQPKSKEDLVNELKSLKEKLVNAQSLAVAAEAVESFAKDHGIDFVASDEYSKEDYIAVVDKILNDVSHKKDLAVGFARKQYDEKNKLIEEKEGLLEEIQYKFDVPSAKQAECQTFFESVEKVVNGEV